VQPPGPDELDDLDVLPAAVFYRRLIIRGFTPAEAGNLTAWRCGLAISERPWRLHEITKLMARRWEEEQRRSPTT